MIFGKVLLNFTAFVVVNGNIHLFKTNWNDYDKKYSTFSESERLATLQEAKNMFYFGYDNYMKYAFPRDELDPIHCTGRGPDKENPSNININDVLGDYALTLVDALDTLAIMGNSSEFQKAVGLIVNNVSFEKPSTVQVFEATIRVMGALISAHLIITDAEQPFGPMEPVGYDNELLHLAHDLGSRLMPAFDATGTGIPYPRVNLQHGVPKNCLNETCLAGAGTLLLEFGLLSRLLQDPVYESVARRSIKQLWNLKSNVTGLFGNVVNIQTGEWIGIMSGLGAGLDSFYEYLLKAYILFGDEEFLQMFNESYETIKYYMRKGRKACNSGSGFPPIYVNVHMRTGEVINHWIDALQAAWPAVQLLKGDLEEAICLHALYYTIWQRYGALPERYNWNLKGPDVHFYPLRPELVESTYLLYQATKNPFYMHVGRDILHSLNNHSKVECGYATIHNVLDKTNEDRMESFFLSETCKYLYLLFDTDNHLNKAPTKYLFSTEGHIFPIKYKFREKVNFLGDVVDVSNDVMNKEVEKSTTVLKVASANYSSECEPVTREKQYFLPVESQYLQQMASIIGVGSS